MLIGSIDTKSNGQTSLAMMSNNDIDLNNMLHKFETIEEPRMCHEQLECEKHYT